MSRLRQARLSQCSSRHSKVTRRLLLWLLLGLAPLRGQSLTILDSNDLHAHLESFARLATAVRQEKMGLTWLPV